MVLSRRKLTRWLAGPAVSLVLMAAPALALDRLDFVIPGATGSVADAVRAASLLQSMQAQGQTDPQDLLAAARADYGRILAALYAKGYYSSVIRIAIDGREAATIPPLDVPSAISTITVQVDPGPTFRFNTTKIAPLAPKTALPEGFRTGLPAESGLVGAALDASILAWREAGHPKIAVLGERVVADHQTALLDVDLQLQPGPQLRFGSLRVAGEDRMRERRIAKIAGLPEGKVFSETELRDAEDRLRRTGIFASVTLTEDERVTAPDLLGITATVVEQKPRRYSFGAEIASLDGLSLNGSWLHRNLLGGGERLKLEAELANIGASESGIDYALGISIDRPATLTRDTTAGLLLQFGHLDEADYSADFVSFGVTFSHVFSKTLTGRAGLSYDYLDGRDPSGAFVFRNLSLPLGLTWDRRDNVRDTTSGFYIDASVTPFAGFGTTGSGVQATFDSRLYRSLGAPGKLVFAIRAQGGAVYGSDLLETPRDLLFFSGGGGSVRGQPYQSLGIPVFKGLANEYQIGGKFFLAGSLELRAKVTKKIGIVGFVDAGSIGLEGFADGFVKAHAGAGIGLRYDTGLGPIRLDVAAPISGDTGDGVQIYIGLGQAF